MFPVLTFPITGTFTRFISTKTVPVPPSLKTLETTAQASEARQWLGAFRSQPIPRDLVELSFSRSSGPGGQNVNKVNTKATLRCPLDKSWIPLWAKSHLLKSPFYVANTNSILITSTAHRSQAQNIDDCLAKLHRCIVAASSESVKNEPSAEQRKRVANFEKAEKLRRRVYKDRRSIVKSGRKDSKGGGAWD